MRFAMTPDRRRALIGMAGFGAGLALGATRLSGAPRAQPGLPGPPVLGAVNAPKRLVMWGSLTCPFTAMLLPVLTKIQADMPAQVSIEWRHFPTHKPDPSLHLASMAFRGPHFWGFTSAVLRFVYDAAGQFSGLTDEKVTQIAVLNGGSNAMLVRARADRSNWQALKRDLMAGRLMGVTRTPGLFHNGYFLTPDGVPRDLAAFDRSLRAMVQS